MLATLKLSNQTIRVQHFKLSDAGGHPNKVPFKCALFEVDKPSDGSPQGAGGKKIRISSAVCDANLQTFVGMALNIDYVNGMADHDPRFKVAVIEKAVRALDGFAWIEGYIYGKDFPDVVATIRYYNGLAAEYNWTDYQFGASLEMEASVKNAEDDENILDVIEFCGTGAAILFADAAAYKSTSFAAKNNQKKEEVSDMKPEEIQAAITAAMEGVKTSITASIEKVVGEVKAEVGAIKTELESVKAAKVEEEKKTEEEKAAADLKAAQERAEKAEKELADLKAKGNQEPERKTATAAQLLAKFGKTIDEKDANDHVSFCAAVDQMNLDPQQSMALKLKHKELMKQQQQSQQ